MASIYATLTWNIPEKKYCHAVLVDIIYICDESCLEIQSVCQKKKGELRKVNAEIICCVHRKLNNEDDATSLIVKKLRQANKKEGMNNSCWEPDILISPTKSDFTA